MHLKYRPEIDGLRAIAVVAVLVYHANFLISGNQLLSGGYLGVDIFFVISGYLITLILLKELQADTFSYLLFYERRARRILPALFVVLAASTLTAWFLLSTLLYENYSGSLASTAVFGSNVFFWGDTGYNAEAGEYKPLLHTWSLAVEEQFYIVFPLLLFIIWKYAKKYLLAVLAGMFLASLAYASWINQYNVNTAFYLIHARAWELMAGAILAHLEFKHGRNGNSLFNKLLPTAGLLAITGSLFLFSQTTSHPGILTLIPVAGTMMIIRFAQPGRGLSRLLGSSTLTSIGLISYSLYLWHQPVFSFARIKAQTESTPLDKLGWIGLSLILAFITYRLIEKPFRNRNRIHSMTIWIGSGTITIAFLAFGLYGYFTGGVPDRLPPFIAKIDAIEKRVRAPLSDGKVICKRADIIIGRCKLAGGNQSGYTIVSVGDSHIASLNKSISDHRPLLHAFVPLTSPACMFVLGLERDAGPRTQCATGVTQKRLNKILAQKNPLVISGGRLPLLIESSRFNNQEGGIEPGNDHPKFVTPGTGANRQADMQTIKQAFSTTARQLLDHGVKLVLVYPIPEAGWHVPRKLASMVAGKNFRELVTLNMLSPLTTSHKVFIERTRKAYAVYDNIPDHENLLRIYPEKLLCDNDRCRTHSENIIYYKDDDHLSYEGADMLVTHIFEEVDNKWGMNPHDQHTDRVD